MLDLFSITLFNLIMRVLSLDCKTVNVNASLNK